jgi:hypothetical protein
MREVDARRLVVCLKNPTVRKGSRDQADDVGDNRTRPIEPNPLLRKEQSFEYYQFIS